MGAAEPARWSGWEFFLWLGEGRTALLYADSLQGSGKHDLHSRGQSEGADAPVMTREEAMDLIGQMREISPSGFRMRERGRRNTGKQCAPVTEESLCGLSNHLSAAQEADERGEKDYSGRQPLL